MSKTWGKPPKFRIPKINYVESDEENGCVIACLAMITGKSFQEVKQGMREFWKNEGMDEGTNDQAFEAYLAARGYAIQHFSHDYIPEDKLLEPWPPAPWAPVHCLDVYADGPHAIVMLHDGTIYDPNDTGMKSIDQYHRVYAVQGIWKVSELNQFDITEL